jgi:hypothetical protein
VDNQAHVTDSNKSDVRAIQNSNTTQALLDDLKERGYELRAKDGKLYTDPKGPPITPVIHWALQANYGKLVKLLSPPVTDTDVVPGFDVRKDNTDWSRVGHLTPKRGDEMKQAIAEYRQSYQDAREVVKAAAPENAIDGIIMVGVEADKRKPGRDREAERRIEASKKGTSCGACGKATLDGQTVYAKCRVYAGMWGGLTPHPGPRFVNATVCGACAPEYMRKPLDSYFDTQIDAKGTTARVYYGPGVAEMPCPTCQRPVRYDRTGRWQPRVFCCYRCEYTYHNQRRSQRDEHLRHKVCEVCSKEFTARRAHTKTCSAACKQKAYRQRKKVAD